MFGFTCDAERITDALSLSHAIIEFGLDGRILNANENFLTLLGYKLSEIRGKHHQMFVDPTFRDSPEYRKFWDDLRAGRHFVAEVPRLTGTGATVWIQGSYNPVLKNGKPYKVVKLATDITEMVRERARIRNQFAAVNRSQATIEFSVEGLVQEANENFLALMGYSLEEVRGKHHRMFVDGEEAASSGYGQFWAELRAGKFQMMRFRRFAKGKKEVWIQASYNPIFDQSGKVIGVIKFATDITEERRQEQRTREQAVATVQQQVSGVSDLIKRAYERARSTAEATTEVSSNVQAVAAGSSQLASSVVEINTQVTKALDISNEAVEQANRAGETVASLVEDARKISAVVELISSIASQTNLLALNATIEAARAGETGRGFAVVAGEVKSLAAQTAQATGEISAHIMAVQASSQHAHQAIGAINNTIAEINEISVSISAAVEEQAAVTADMSHNMLEAAHKVDTITRSTDEVAHLTSQADEGVHHIAVVSTQAA